MTRSSRRRPASAFTGTSKFQHALAEATARHHVIQPAADIHARALQADAVLTRNRLNPRCQACIRAPCAAHYFREPGIRLSRHLPPPFVLRPIAATWVTRLCTQNALALSGEITLKSTPCAPDHPADHTAEALTERGFVDSARDHLAGRQPPDRRPRQHRR